VLGTLHIFRLDDLPDKYGKSEIQYQVSIGLTGTSFIRTVSDAELTHFLRSDLAIADDQALSTIASLNSSGRATVADVEISENKASELGMEQEPSDV